MQRLPLQPLRLALLAIVGWLLAGFGSAAFAQPSLTYASPGAVAPGKTTDLTLRGAKLDQPVQIWTSFPARIEIAPGDPKGKDAARIDCKIMVPAGVPVGIGGIAVATPLGISDVLLVMIDDLPSISDNNNNHAAATPQDVQLPAAIDGLSEGTTFDYYRFAAKAGQRVACELVATRLGWDFDAVVRLLDATGNEVLRADDDPATAADARFAFKAPADGQFVLELRDNRFKQNGRYRLRLGDFPIATTASPLAVQAGTAASVSFSGPLVEGLTPFTFLSPSSGLPRQLLAVSSKSPSGQASGFANVIAGDLPVFVDSAPADKPNEATPATLPCTLAGTLEAPKDRDLFQFAATKGASVTFRATTRSAGSAAILMLRLLNADGSQVAESPITDSDEPFWTVAIPADGTFKLAVEELAGRGGPDYTYAVEARPGPQFSLGLKVDPKVPARTRIPLAAGGAFHLDVVATRTNYDGPITLAIDSPRLGWQVFNNVIAAKANEVRMYVVAPLDYSPAEIAAVRIVGRADSTASGTTAALSTVAQLRTARPQTPYPAGWLDGLVLVSGLASSPPLYTVGSEKNEVTIARSVGQGQISLAFTRTDDKFKDPLTLLPLGLPAGITAEIKRNGNGPKETYDIILKGPKDMAEGTHTFRYLAYADLTGRGQAVQSGDLRINVISPLAVVATPAGPLVAGQKQKVKLTLTRKGDDKQPVDLKFKMLPPGVTAPEKTTLAIDQNEVEVELSAAADAKPVKFDQLIAVASGKYAGADVSVESAAVVLEVKAP